MKLLLLALVLVLPWAVLMRLVMRGGALAMVGVGVLTLWLCGATVWLLAVAHDTRGGLLCARYTTVQQQNSSTPVQRCIG